MGCFSEWQYSLISSGKAIKELTTSAEILLGLVTLKVNRLFTDGRWNVK